MKKINSINMEFFLGSFIIFVITYIINEIFYVGVIDNPTFYIFIIPAVINLYFLLNKKNSSKLKKFNRVLLGIMIVLFVFGIPKYSYKGIEEKIMNTRFKNEQVKILELSQSEKRIDSLKRPSFLVEKFYRVKVQLQSGEELNFYTNPESGEWVEK